MSQPSDLAEVLAALASAFRAAGVRWYLFGAQAVAVYGVPRLTADVDVTIESSPDEVGALVAMLRRGGFEPRIAELETFAHRTRVLPVGHVSTGIPVDLVLSGPGLEEEFLSRAREIDLGGVAVPVIAPEDLIVTKVLAGRVKDLEDVRGILRERGSELDLELARQTLSLLERALDRDDLVSCLEGLTQEPG